ncbi:transposable element Tcb2 transposase, partial [Trichonephila clavipes]
DLEPFLETGSAGQRPGQGRRWAPTPNEDHYLVLTARRHRNVKTILLQQQHLRLPRLLAPRFQLRLSKPAPWCVHLYARRPMRNRTNGIASLFSRHGSIARLGRSRKTAGLLAADQTPHKLSKTGRRALLEEWDRIPQLVINSHIDSMPQRCSTLLDVRGNHTPY